MLLPITVFGYTRVFLINFVSEKAEKYKEIQKVYIFNKNIFIIELDIRREDFVLYHSLAFDDVYQRDYSIFSLYNNFKK